MGAGKSTLGPEIARRLGRPFLDVDREIESSHGPVWELFEREGEAAFREVEARFVKSVCSRREPSVVAVGGGAVETRRLLGELDAFVVHLDVDVDAAWERVRGTRRPLAQDEAEFRRRYERRRPLYLAVADAVAHGPDEVVLAAAGIRVGLGALELLGSLVPGDVPLALVTDPHVGGIHGAAAQLALGERLVSTLEVPAGEAAKTAAAVQRLWQELTIPRDALVVALGGGCVTDVAGFVAATYLRGVPWVAVPTTLVGQVDAAIGGKTAIDLPHGKNLVGAFHWPARTVIDPALLETLPDRERREGMAEVVKTGLLAGEALWELPQAEQVERCAAFKAAVCLRDPLDRGERAMLNLGHTFAHALEAAAGYDGVTHGSAVALGLLAALRLSGRSTDVVEEVLQPHRVRVDRERAWAALERDKKRGLVLLGDAGPRWDVQVPADDVRRALDELIAD
ncbi:MAG TPA: bifunctional shikimate kinase/3-dehydroquinate synthase [Gaiellaceae bacterium]|jgi:shikimate kinase/3-dehydroquinate synthase|nr:bifunctional shikimate kinase/3-dehydroquinate synthase [Gaiellaceae bacterium]